MRHTDPKQMLDGGAPTSTGGILNSLRLCYALAMPLKLWAQRERYNRGWGGIVWVPRP